MTRLNLALLSESHGIDCKPPIVRFIFITVYAVYYFTSKHQFTLFYNLHLSFYFTVSTSTTPISTQKSPIAMTTTALDTKDN